MTATLRTIRELINNAHVMFCKIATRTLCFAVERFYSQFQLIGWVLRPFSVHVWLCRNEL